MTETVLVVNAGSSSTTFQLFSVVAGDQLEQRRCLPQASERTRRQDADLARWLAGFLLPHPTDEELMIARLTLRVMYAYNAAMLEEKRA